VSGGRSRVLGEAQRKRPAGLWSRAFRFALCLAPTVMVSTPTYAAGDAGAGKLVGGMVMGPAALILGLGAIAVVYLAAVGVHRQDSLVMLARGAADRLMNGRATYVLWGLLAEILLVSAGAIVARFKILALLTIFLFFLAVALAGLGALVAAFATGRRFQTELSSDPHQPVGSLGVGLLIFLIAVAVPVAGWIVIILATAAGIGATLSTLAQGDEPG
jgi:hypothetical protein